MAAIGFVLTDVLAYSIIYVALYFLGVVILRIFKQDENGLKIFFITYGSSLLYALALFIYMQYNNYEFLQSYDGHNVYLPYTLELLNSGSLFELIQTIYSTSKYSFVGAILIPFVYIGKLSTFLGGDLYLPIQFVIMLFSSLASVVVYNILTLKGISSKKALKYTLIYSLISVQFIMSTYIVRDMPITLFFYLLIFLSFKPFSTKRIFIMLIIIAAIMSIRLSSGIFASIYIILVLFFSSKDNRESNKIMRTVFFISSMILLYVFSNTIITTINTKSHQYEMLANEDQGGNSTLEKFNILPEGLSHLAKATYNQFMPIPSWRSMIKTSYRPESYNVMNFPNVINTFYNYIIWFIILISLLMKRLRGILYKNKILFFHFIIAVLFLMLQSSTMGHRRMMGVYPIFFLIALLFYRYYNIKDKRVILGGAVIFFLSIQVIGAFYIS